MCELDNPEYSEREGLRVPFNVSLETIMSREEVDCSLRADGWACA